MTSALLERKTTSAARPRCPRWCTNPDGECATAGGGDLWHTGRVGTIQNPTTEEWLGVELFRYDNADGTVHQMSVLVVWDYDEGFGQCHIALDLEVARELADTARSVHSDPIPIVTFGGGMDITFTVERLPGQWFTTLVMDDDDQNLRMTLGPQHLRSLGDLVGSACVMAEAVL